MWFKNKLDTLYKLIVYDNNFLMLETKNENAFKMLDDDDVLKSPEKLFQYLLLNFNETKTIFKWPKNIEKFADHSERNELRVVLRYNDEYRCLIFCNNSKWINKNENDDVTNKNLTDLIKNYLKDENKIKPIIYYKNVDDFVNNGICEDFRDFMYVLNHIVNYIDIDDKHSVFMFKYNTDFDIIKTQFIRIRINYQNNPLIYYLSPFIKTPNAFTNRNKNVWNDEYWQIIDKIERQAKNWRTFISDSTNDILTSKDIKKKVFLNDELIDGSLDDGDVFNDLFKSDFKIDNTFFLHLAKAILDNCLLAFNYFFNTNHKLFIQVGFKNESNTNTENNENSNDLFLQDIMNIFNIEPASFNKPSLQFETPSEFLNVLKNLIQFEVHLKNQDNKLSASIKLKSMDKINDWFRLNDISIPLQIVISGMILNVFNSSLSYKELFTKIFSLRNNLDLARYDCYEDLGLLIEDFFYDKSVLVSNLHYLDDSLKKGIIKEIQFNGCLKNENNKYLISYNNWYDINHKHQVSYGNWNLTCILNDGTKHIIVSPDELYSNKITLINKNTTKNNKIDKFYKFVKFIEGDLGDNQDNKEDNQDNKDKQDKNITSLLNDLAQRIEEKENKEDNGYKKRR